MLTRPVTKAKNSIFNMTEQAFLNVKVMIFRLIECIMLFGLTYVGVVSSFIAQDV